jgi:hypothetical protein
LHLVEHVGERGLEPQRRLDLIGRDVRVLAVLQEARNMMVTDVLDERGGIFFPVLAESSRLVNTVSIPVWLNNATASSVYLSKSVSKMP